MANLGKIHVGDVNTDLVLTVQDTTNGSNAAFDFNANPPAANGLQIIIIDPDGNETTLTGSLNTPPGTDGVIHKVNADSTLFDEGGLWGWKAKITLADGSIYTSNTLTFEVLD